MAYPKRLFLGLGISIANGWPNNQGGGTLPVFTLQPQSQTVDEYETATFSCEVAGGIAPYSYQWKKNAANVGTNSAALSFATAASDNAASITVVVTDSAGSVITSNGAVLSVMRNVVTFNGTTQSASVPSFSLQADFSIDIEFSTTNTNNQLLIGDSHITNLYINASSVAGFSFYYNGDLFRVVAPANAFDGSRHVLRYEKVGTNLRAFFDGVLIPPVKVVPDGISNINLIIGSSNSNQSANFFGKMYKVVISSQDITVRDYRMNDGFAGNPLCANSGTDGVAGNGTYIGLTAASWTREVAS